jgi:hypothetical protein
MVVERECSTIFHRCWDASAVVEGDGCFSLRSDVGKIEKAYPATVPPTKAASPTTIADVVELVVLLILPLIWGRIAVEKEERYSGNRQHERCFSFRFARRGIRSYE